MDMDMIHDPAQRHSLGSQSTDSVSCTLDSRYDSTMSIVLPTLKKYQSNVLLQGSSPHSHPVCLERFPCVLNSCMYLQHKEVTWIEPQPCYGFTSDAWLCLMFIRSCGDVWSELYTVTVPKQQPYKQVDSSSTSVIEVMSTWSLLIPEEVRK